MDPTSDNNIQPGSSEVPDQPTNNTDHPAERHHHSHRYRRHSRSHHHRSGKIRIEELPKRKSHHKTESIFARNVLKIFGILFIILAVWLTISSITPLNISSVFNVKDFFKVTERHHVPFPTPVQAAPQQLQPQSKIAFGIQPSKAGFIIPLCLVFVFVLISYWLKRIETEIISLASWIIFALYWLIMLFTSNARLLLTGYLIASTVMYAAFVGSDLIIDFSTEKKWLKWIKSGMILLNAGFYYLTFFIVLHKYGLKNYEFLFTLILAASNLGVVFFASKTRKHFNRNAYLLVVLFTVCMILPLIFRKNLATLFLAPFSFILLLFSKYAKNQSSILIALASMIIMVLVYLYHWIFEFFPAVFVSNILDNKPVFYKGLIASLIILFTVLINYQVLRKLDIKLSKKFFSRSTYLKLMKGILLGTAYLSLFWIFHFFLLLILRDNIMKTLIWFSFNCLYFITVIIYLGKTRSSFLRIMLVISIILNLVYPLLINSYIVDIRNLYLQSDAGYLRLFIFHYIGSVCLVGLLFIQLYYFKRAFSRKKYMIRGFWIYYIFMLMFILFSEYDHLSVIIGYRQGVQLREIVENNQKIPYSILLIASSLVILITGFVRKSRFIRMTSLILLTLTLAKILIMDIGSLSNTGKTILFFTLGVMLLGVSFFYSKVKHFFLSSHSQHKRQVAGEKTENLQ